MTDFYVGQRVVCVDDGDHPEWLIPNVPAVGGLDGLRRGVVYTVSRWNADEWGNGPTVELVEIVRPCRGIIFDYRGFHPRRFRPLEEPDFKSEWVTQLADDLRAGRPLEIA